MTREDALELLENGPSGVAKWNARRRRARTRLPDLSDAVLSHTDLSGADLSDVELTGAHLTGAVLGGANLSGADLLEVSLSGADLSDADLSDADLSGADLTDANLTGANLTNALLRDVSLGGANLSNANLTGAVLSDTNLISTDLSGADLTGADLTGADLSGADLSGVDLSRANLSNTDLSSANLTGTDLSGANLTDTNMCETWLGGADLRAADLTGSNLRGADLRSADLTGADLSSADLTGADLTGADLSSANLTLARLIRANLTGAKVENALVQDIHFHELCGLPVPPAQLRRGKLLVTGADAANFFVLPAVVEVYLSRALGDGELGCLHFHMGEVHGNRVAEDVYLIGHRHESGGSVLRFQGPTYDAVYAALPDLLAPFRTADAIDWHKTLGAVPPEERGELVTALVKAETRLKAGRWRIASRLAEAFEGFAGARVVKFTDGRRKGVSLTVYSDPAALVELDRRTLPAPPAGAALVFPGPTQISGGVHMGDKISIGGNAVGSAIGRGAQLQAHDIVANILQSAAQSPNADLAAAVRAAVAALGSAKLAEPDHKEAAETVEKVQAEVTKSDPDPGRPGRLKRWLDGLAAICKPAADALTAAKAVATALGV